MTYKPPILIGFCGKMSSGKTTAAKYLVKYYNAERHTFATPIKHVVKDLFDFSPSQIDGTLEEKNAIDPRYGISYRESAQRFGAAVRKHLGSHTFVGKLFENILASKANMIVIDDVRHYEEAHRILAERGHLITLICTDDIDKENSYGNHESETQVDQIMELSDIVIKSYRTPNSTDLLLKVEMAMRSCLSEIDWRRLESDNFTQSYKLIDKI